LAGLDSRELWGLVVFAALGAATLARSVQFYFRSGERRAERMRPHWNATVFRTGGVVGGVPGGAGIFLISLALALPHDSGWRWVSYPLLAIGFFGLILGLIFLIAWHPRRLRPRWMQSREWD
jgi:H+/Cl- antiporter ClcA